MSQENVEVVRAQYDHLNRLGEPKREDYASDTTFDATRLLGFGIYRDQDEFVAAWLQYRDTFDEWGIEVEEILDGHGGRVFAAVRDGGRVKASGAEVRSRFFHIWELRDGKIVAWTVFLDRSPALEAAGLRE
jgi:ketosteroid isomerase-like protein